MLVEVVEHHNRTLCRDKASIETDGEKVSKDFDLSSADMSVSPSIETIAPNKVLAITFLKRSDKTCYKYLLKHLESHISLGTDQNPTALPSSFMALGCYVKPIVTSPCCYRQEPDNRNGIT